MGVLKRFCWAMACCISLAGCGSDDSNTVSKTDPTNNPEPVPTLSILDISVFQGSMAKLKVRLSRPSTSAVTVAYATKADSANEGTDFRANSGTLIFIPGQTEKTIEVVILRTNVKQPETKILTVELYDSNNANIIDSNAVVTIIPTSQTEPTPTPTPTPTRTCQRTWMKKRRSGDAEW